MKRSHRMLKTLAFAVLPILALAGVVSAQTLSVNPASLTFVVPQGSTTVQSQQVQILSSRSSISWYAQLPSRAPSWLSIARANGITGTTPLNVSVNPTGLAQGTYSGTIAISAPAAVNSPQIVAVALFVGLEQSGGFTVSPASLTFRGAASGANPAAQTVSLTSNTPLFIQVFSAMATTSSGGSWLAVTPSSGFSSYTPSTLTVTVNTSGLAAGSYTGRIDITGPRASPTFVQVTLTVSPALVITVNPPQLSFSFQPGGAAPPSQALAISSSGGAGLGFTTAVSANWIAVTPTSGTTPASLTVFVQPYALQAGVHAATITIAASGGNSQVIPVSLVIAAGAMLTASPGSLSFTQVQGGPVPGAKALEITVSPATAGPVSFTATTTTNQGGNWLSVQPLAGATPGVLTVSANGAGLPQGTYAGQITSQSAGTSTSPVSVTVTLTIGPQQSVSVVPQTLTFSYQPGAALPQPQSLTVSSTGGPANFTGAASTITGGGWLSLSPLSGTTPASLKVSVSPGSLPPGEYAGTVTVTSATAGNSPQTASVRLVINSVSLPVVTKVVNAASALPTAAAPGLIVSIFGANLGPTQGDSGRVVGGVLESTVAETRVMFDSNPAPLLYVSADQINAIVPYAVAGRFSTQLQVEYRGTRSSALVLQVVDAAPGIFTMNKQGTGPGAILNQDYSVNGLTRAAARGSVVMIYATGEGQTSPGGVDGRLAGSAPYPAPVLPVKVTIGGRDTEVLYAGAAPGFVAGSMQINVRIPNDAPTGDEVPVLISVGNRNSQPTATLAIR
jgi:uncharacterized protein (TIGR03437 family)